MVFHTHMYMGIGLAIQFFPFNAVTGGDQIRWFHALAFWDHRPRGVLKWLLDLLLRIECFFLWVNLPSLGIRWEYCFPDVLNKPRRSVPICFFLLRVCNGRNAGRPVDVFQGIAMFM